MQTMIFVTLPVTDIATSRRFYESLGWTVNAAFSSDSSVCMAVSDTIHVMLATHADFAAASKRPLVLPGEGATNLIALSFQSRAEVDAIMDAALAAGGTSLHDPEDLGFMYSRAFADPDGNGFGPFWMDPAAASG